MKTQCNGQKLEFQQLASRDVEAQFDGGTISSEGGSLSLREVEQKYSVIRKFAECFSDHRDPARTEHTARELLAQRVVGLCSAYEDLDDHAELRPIR